MNTRTKKSTYTVSIFLLLGVAFFVITKDYQQENISRLFSQIFSSEQANQSHLTTH